jgi:hypothetical protein
MQRLTDLGLRDSAHHKPGHLSAEFLPGDRIGPWEMD